MRNGRTIRQAGMRARAAFTFIEILATLSLLGVVLPTVMTGVSLSLATAKVAKAEAQAAALANSKLMELVANQQWSNGGGEFGNDWPRYRWTSQATSWDGTTLEELDVTVTWRDRTRERSVTLATLVNTGTQN